tara:strand:+ start:1259 stop:1690 length:432 start_codon:yes stop_codon:yes gene_type:complete
MILHSDLENNYNIDDNCLICHDLLEKDSIAISENGNIPFNSQVILKCSHKFHYNCIFNTYKINNKRECPYCRNIGDFLELKDGMIPFYNIHKEFDDYVNGDFNLDNINYIEGKCKKILKSGKNPGTQCKNKPKSNKNYCGKHL